VSDTAGHERRPDDLFTVAILGCPVDVILEGQRHAEALMRELTIIVDGGGDKSEFPKRFFEVVEVVQRRAAGLNTGAEKVLETAIECGDAEVDFDVVMPVSFGPGAPVFAALLDELDEYCRSGDLLTLETPPEVRAFQRWYIDQIEQQCQGAPPVRWSTWRASEAGKRATRL
jgi:hypothetical protein